MSSQSGNSTASTPPYRTSGKALKKLMIDHDLSQGDLAKKLGVVTATVNRWCGGWSRPAECYWGKMGSVFGMTADAIYRRLFMAGVCDPGGTATPLSTRGSASEQDSEEGDDQ